MHAGLVVPPSAEALMRSRYSAFALGKSHYLKASWHSSTRPQFLDLPEGKHWLQLKLLEAREGEREAFVEFVARYRSGGSTEVLHEVSRFVKEAGRWLYVDGVIQN